MPFRRFSSGNHFWERAICPQWRQMGTNRSFPLASANACFCEDRTFPAHRFGSQLRPSCPRCAGAGDRGYNDPATAFRRDAGGDAGCGERIAEPVSIIYPVGENGSGRRQGSGHSPIRRRFRARTRPRVSLTIGAAESACQYRIWQEKLIRIDASWSECRCCAAPAFRYDIAGGRMFMTIVVKISYFEMLPLRRLAA